LARYGAKRTDNRDHIIAIIGVSTPRNKLLHEGIHGSSMSESAAGEEGAPAVISMENWLRRVKMGQDRETAIDRRERWSGYVHWGLYLLLKYGTWSNFRYSACGSPGRCGAMGCRIILHQVTTNFPLPFPAGLETSHLHQTRALPQPQRSKQRPEGGVEGVESVEVGETPPCLARR
jgi:hypothetical protein